MSALRGQLRALSNDRNLRCVVVQATPTGIHLGTGSYGSVEEVTVNGLLCAGKKIHEILLDTGNIGVREIAAKYFQECQLMSNLRHPHITLFIGVCFFPDCQLPLLVMERLEESLDNLLETVPNIPLALKRSFLEDTARGLLYLHKQDPQIIHRDLTAKNVLLTSSLVAKITDLGNSRIVNIQPGQLAQTLSRNPGTLVYMPPEALTAASRYGPSLDIFSFGHLGIFVGLQVFPRNLLEPTYHASDSSDDLIARSEVDRRGLYLERLQRMLPPNGGEHPLVLLLKQCLKNNPSQRPTAEELITSLVGMKGDIDGPYGEVAKADAVRQVVTMRALRKRDTEVREKSDESAAKDVEIHQLQQELEHEQAERTRAEQQLQQNVTQLLQKDNQLQQNDAQIQQKDAQLQQKDARIQQNEAELGQARTQLQQKATELSNTQQSLQQRDNLIQQKDAEHGQTRIQLERQSAELNNVQQNLQRLRSDLENREVRLRAQEEEMQQRDAEINRLMGELRRCQVQILRQQEGVSAVGEESSHWSKEQEIKQTPLAELKIPLKLKWRQGKYMPNGMGGPIQAVVFGSDVYVGGGYGQKEETVMVYSLQTGTWRTLPPYESCYFGMAVVNNQLVLVGGWIKSTGKVTNVLGVWDEQSRTWTHPFPVMPTARRAISAISYQKWLVVAGGYSGRGLSNKVELLDTLSGQWYEGSPLPKECYEMSSAINGNMWYLSRGFSPTGPNKHVYSLCLDSLISQTVSQSAGTTSPSIPSPWQMLPEVPGIYSTVLIIEGALLTVGGSGSSAVHLYQPGSRSWVKVGDLPTQRWRCACIVLPSGEVFVAAGCSSGLSYNRSVAIATIV